MKVAVVVAEAVEHGCVRDERAQSARRTDRERLEPLVLPVIVVPPALVWTITSESTEQAA